VLVWVYYSAQIFFFGAEFTQVYAAQLGSDPVKKREKAKQPPPPRLRGKESSLVCRTSRAECGGCSGGATATAGTVLGSALAITKLVQMFRRR
jgi:hypothetical protein